MFSALIFDLDGTIVDTETPYYEIWKQFFKEHGADLPIETWSQWVGKENDSFDPADILEEKIGREVDRATLKERFIDNYQRWSDQQPILPGVTLRLEEAKNLGWKLGVASSSPFVWVERHLRIRELWDHFETIKARDHVEKAKPSPDLYLAAAEELKCDPKQCLVFEDSLNGLRAAKAAGMTCVVTPTSLTAMLDLTAADLRLKTLADMSLSEMIKKIGS